MRGRAGGGTTRAGQQGQQRDPSDPTDSVAAHQNSELVAGQTPTTWSMMVPASEPLVMS